VSTLKVKCIPEILSAYLNSITDIFQPKTLSPQT